MTRPQASIALAGSQHRAEGAVNVVVWAGSEQANFHQRLLVTACSTNDTTV
jgi:hypothetical protein